MDPVTISVILWATDSTASPLAVIGGLAGTLAVIISAFVGYGTYKSNQTATVMKLSLESLEMSLKRSDKDVDDLTTELHEARARHAEEIAALRVSLSTTQAELDQLKAAFSTERRAHADRVKVLVRQIRRLGGTPDEEDGL